MIASMTGFAAVTQELGNGTLNVELRAVNNRYLDVQFRLSEELRPAEFAMREQISQRISRGKVECRIYFNVKQDQVEQMQLNQPLLTQLIDFSRLVQATLPESGQLGVGEILRWPGMLVAETLSVETLIDTSQALLTTALGEFESCRQREGTKLQEALLNRVGQMEALITGILPKIPQLIEAYRQKLLLRLKEALATIEEEKLHHELALFAQRIDVDEELTRLHTHLIEVRRILDQGGIVGKRLDFMMQELNREANTLGSKSVSTETSQIALNLKVLIEQMREQIQNIE